MKCPLFYYMSLKSAVFKTVGFLEPLPLISGSSGVLDCDCWEEENTSLEQPILMLKVFTKMLQM